jgi:putative intracellular protease/amidase
MVMDFIAGPVHPVPQLVRLTNRLLRRPTMKSPKILIIVTSHAKLGDSGQQTGFWLEELAVPYYEFVNAGAEVDIASPLGGKPPADPKSEQNMSEEVSRFISDPDATRKLANTLTVEEAIGRDYDAVFAAGGHGTMWDLATSKSVAAILSKAYAQGKIVAAVCHGPAALVNAQKASGEPLVKGHRVSAFSNAEETGVGLDKIVPFMLADKLTELGGKYEGGEKWQPFAILDGQLVTGQNPASSRLVAQYTLKAVASRR